MFYHYSTTAVGHVCQKVSPRIAVYGGVINIFQTLLEDSICPDLGSFLHYVTADELVITMVRDCALCVSHMIKHNGEQVSKALLVVRCGIIEQKIEHDLSST